MCIIKVNNIKGYKTPDGIIFDDELKARKHWAYTTGNSLFEFLELDDKGKEKLVNWAMKCFYKEDL
jgi:hypothetical protein